MKSLSIFITCLLIVGYGAFQFLTPEAFSYANMPPAGRAGDPGNGMLTCNTSGCHSGSATQTASGWITSNIPAGGYVAGNTYTITGTATYVGRNTFGFEISPQNAAGTILGTIVNTSTQTAILTAGYIGQRSNGLLGSGSKSWSFDWIAPSAGTGVVTFYGAFNCANGTGGTGGDFIYTSTLTVQESSTGITQYQSLKGISVYPVPNAGVFFVNSLTDPITKIELFDMNSKKLKAYHFNNALNKVEMNISEQSAGIYFIKIASKEKINIQKIILTK